MQNQVTERALVQRINRKLAHGGRLGQKLHKYRGGRWRTNLGDFYVIDGETGFLVQTHVDLEQYGRQVGALAEWEALSEDGGQR